MHSNSADCKRAYMKRAHINAPFLAVDCRGTDFDHVTIDGEFIAVDCGKASFSGAKINGAFTNVNCDDADFSETEINAPFVRSTLTRVQLAKAKLGDKAHFIGCTPDNPRHPDQQGGIS